MSTQLSLSMMTPIVEGGVLALYADPQDSNQIIKIIRPKVLGSGMGGVASRHGIPSRFRQYISYMRETAEHIAMVAQYGGGVSIAQQIVGFVDTDLGLGLVIGAERDRSGNPAVSLESLLKSGGFDREAKAALHHFIGQVLATDIIIGDLNAKSMVYAYSKDEGNHFVMIHGIGSSTIFSLKAIFPSINRMSKQRHVARLCRHINRLLPCEDSGFFFPKARGGTRPPELTELHCQTRTARLMKLKPHAPLATGKARLVFAHPDTSELIVKVMRPELVEERYGEGAAWFRRGRRHDPYVLFLREISEYVATYASHQCSLPFAQKVCGLIETDFGLGLVTEAARAPDGKLAPTVAKLVEVGDFNQHAENALEKFLADVLASDLVLADLHERNVVYGCAADGTRRFVMIDGLGTSTLIPFKSLSRTLNRRSKEKRVVRLRKRIQRRVTAWRDGKPIP